MKYKEVTWISEGALQSGNLRWKKVDKAEEE